MTLTAKEICVTGIVQGVGFRPFVYRIAEATGVAGSVSNNSEGVFIVVEGDGAAIKRFEAALVSQSPPLAHILAMESVKSSPQGRSGFVIVTSEGRGAREALISPDYDVCPDCLKELFDATDRRYRYPFINCTNCGPRYSIIADIPYDRPNTTMRDFPLCHHCRTEYENPTDRRFHAQPVACAECGPVVTFRNVDFAVIPCADPIAKTIATLKQGSIVAIKGLGGYHLVVNALNGKAVKELRKRKKRVGKPFALMVKDRAAAQKFVTLTTADATLLEDRAHPILLLPRLHSETPLDVAPSQKNLGVFLPYTPLHHLLFVEGRFDALVMTSANVSNDPLAHTEEEAKIALASIADNYLTHNRPILNRSDDSIERPMAHGPVLLRRARGYAPIPIMLDKKYPPTLAIGADLKNTFCYIKGDKAFVSQHIGDLTYERSYTYLEESLDRFLRLIDAEEPLIVAIDKHPDSAAATIARAHYKDARIVSVQHHHAHMVSLMAERGSLDKKTLGLVFDGAGFGDDTVSGASWGGEFLVGDAFGYERVASTRPLKLPGGDAATREPWRIARVILDDLFGDPIPDLPWLRTIPDEKQNSIVQMARRSINTPLAHGVGRLFDGAAALLGLCPTVTYEGEGAMKLEAMVDETEQRSYAFALITSAAGPRIDWAPAFRELVNDQLSGVSVACAAARFHNGLIDATSAMVHMLAPTHGIQQVALTGGCFQNRILSDRLGARLLTQGFTLLRHSRIPPNDGGVSLGQAIVAARNSPTHVHQR